MPKSDARRTYFCMVATLNARLFVILGMGDAVGLSGTAFRVNHQCPPKNA